MTVLVQPTSTALQCHLRHPLQEHNSGNLRAADLTGVIGFIPPKGAKYE